MVVVAAIAICVEQASFSGGYLQRHVLVCRILWDVLVCRILWDVLVCRIVVVRSFHAICNSLSDMDSISDIINFIVAKPLYVVIALYVINRIWNIMQPSPELEGGPEAIKDIDEWKALLKEKKDSIIVVDFYAPWCGPCKKAAPAFHKMSQEVEFENIVFRKVNVDSAADIARECSIETIPMFKIFRNGKAIETFKGFSQQQESDLREALRKASKTS